MTSALRKLIIRYSLGAWFYFCFQRSVFMGKHRIRTPRLMFRDPIGGRANEETTEMHCEGGGDGHCVQQGRRCIPREPEPFINCPEITINIRIQPAVQALY